MSSLTLNVSRDGASTTSLDNLCQCFITLIVKNVFLLFRLNLPSFSLKPLPLVLSQQALLKTLSLEQTSSSYLRWRLPDLPGDTDAVAVLCSLVSIPNPIVPEHPAVQPACPSSRRRGRGVLRSPSAGRKRGLPGHCARREDLSPDSMSVPAAYSKDHGHLQSAHTGQGKGTEISKLWDYIRLQLVLGVQFQCGVEAAREMGRFVQNGPDPWLCRRLRLPRLSQCTALLCRKS